MFHSIADQRLADARLNASTRTFPPSQVLKCRGRPFRSQRTRNLACLFDLDPNVHAWTCLPVLLRFGDGYHVPDFAVRRSDGDYLVDTTPPPEWAIKAAESEGWSYDCVSYKPDDNHAFIANAADLLPYAQNSTISLSDRVRLLAALDDDGPLALKHCIQLVRGTADPMSAIATLYFSGEISFDLTERISPETRVSRT